MTMCILLHGFLCKRDPSFVKKSVKVKQNFLCIFCIFFCIQAIISEVFTLTLPKKNNRDHEQVQSATATIILPTRSSSTTSFQEEHRYPPNSEAATICRPFSRKRVWKLYWNNAKKGVFYNYEISQVKWFEKKCISKYNKPSCDNTKFKISAARYALPFIFWGNRKRSFNVDFLNWFTKHN